MKITNEEKQETIDMWRTGKFYLREIAEWLGISMSSVTKIIKEYTNGKTKTD